MLVKKTDDGTLVGVPIQSDYNPIGWCTLNTSVLRELYAASSFSLHCCNSLGNWQVVWWNTSRKTVLKINGCLEKRRKKKGGGGRAGF